MNIKRFFMSLFFLVVMPTLIFFTTETMFGDTISATDYPDEYIIKVTEADTDKETLENLNKNTGIEQNRNFVKRVHPLKYMDKGDAVSSLKTEDSSKKEELELNKDKVSKENNKVEDKVINKEYGDLDITDDDLELMAKFVNAESKEGAYNEKVAISSVLLNRLNSNSFGDTIEDIIYAKNQFSSIVNGKFEVSVPADEDYNAVIEAVKDKDRTDGALYYYNPQIVTSEWHETLFYIDTIDNNRFFREVSDKTKKKAKELIKDKTEIKEEKNNKENTKKVKETSNKEKSVDKVEEVSKVSKEVSNYSRDELDMMAKMIYAEAGAEPFEGKVAVGAVIMNRLKSNSFGNTIKDVLYAKKQFSPITDGSFDKAKPTSAEYDAAKRALSGEDPTNGADYFYNPSMVVSKWHESLNYTKTIGSHKFFKSK